MPGTRRLWRKSAKPYFFGPYLSRKSTSCFFPIASASSAVFLSKGAVCAIDASITRFWYAVHDSIQTFVVLLSAGDVSLHGSGLFHFGAVRQRDF